MKYGHIKRELIARVLEVEVEEVEKKQWKYK